MTVAAVSPLRTPNSVRARVTTIPPGSCSSRVMMSSKKYAFSLPLPLPRTGTGNTHRGHRTQRMSDLNCPTKNLYQNHVKSKLSLFPVFPKSKQAAAISIDESILSLYSTVLIMRTQQQQLCSGHGRCRCWGWG